MLVNAVASAFLNLGLLAGFPFLLYFAYQKLRRGRDFREIARRAGLQVGEIRFIGYSVIFALFSVTILIVWSPGEAILRQGSASRQFLGLGFSVPAVVMALLYGVVKTGFPEELLFRGLIAGSLSRWLPDVWANVVPSDHLPDSPLVFVIHHARVMVESSSSCLRVSPLCWLGADQIWINHRGLADPTPLSTWRWPSAWPFEPLLKTLLARPRETPRVLARGSQQVIAQRQHEPRRSLQ